MNQFRSPFGAIPPVVKNLILINIVLFFATMAFQQLNLTRVLGLFYPGSEYFKPHQLVTHMFMHGGFTHIFFNMFALFMFGRVLESVWGPRRFLVYYFVTGLGAAALHTFVNYLQLSSLESQLSPEAIQMVYQDGAQALTQGKNFIDHSMAQMNLVINIPTVGASGAVFGLLLAFGALFPNTQLMLIFPPIPIKAKYFVIGYGLIELYLGFSRSGSNIAHFAHIGGMLFGYILIRYWNKKSKNFY